MKQIRLRFCFFSGGNSAFSMSYYSMISDITKPEYRAMRMGFISIATMISRPFAAPFGAWLLEQGREA